MYHAQHRRIDGPTTASAGLSFIVFAYVAARAATMCITLDEAATYNGHVTNGWLDILLFRTDGLPDNNHLLHTLLAKLSVGIFGVSELTLRLPTLFGTILYLLGLNLCLPRVVSGWKAVPGLLAVAMNPYVVDFLGVARGYGLGLGFTMLGLAALLRAFGETPGRIREGHARIGIMLFGLAALSNLSFLLVLGGAMLLVGGFVLVRGLAGAGVSESASSPWPLVLARLLLPGIPFIAYLALPLYIIRQWKLFGEGGQAGFWNDTVGGLVNGTAYDNNWFWSYIQVMTDWVVVVSLFVPVALLLLWRKDRRRFAVLAVLAGMTFTVALASILQHHLMHVAYLQGRRGIFFTPLFLLTAIALGDPPRTSSRWYSVPAVLLGFVAPMLLVVQNIYSANLKSLYDWPEYGGTRPAMLAVREEIGRNAPGRPCKMRVDEPYFDTMNFYRSMYGMERLLLPVELDGLDGPADFYYGFIRDEAKMAAQGARPLYRHAESGTILCVRDKPAGGHGGKTITDGIVP
ncbi:MAG: hypothetical protein HGB02_04215 [Chlorobiaceae bacterium]|nr:hypothetical protein [Chlorobiaceae bacterium]